MRFVFVGRTRTVWKRLLAYLYTFGISRRVWLDRINHEVDGHEALHLNHGLNRTLLVLPIIGPTIVQFQTARRIDAMVADSPVQYGNPAAIWAASLFPVLGNLWFIGWTQTKLNAFWAHAVTDPKRGMEISVDLSDPSVQEELAEARERSRKAGSRQDDRREQRRERWARRRHDWAVARDERIAVREAGGSTPILPWQRPKRPPRVRLDVVCTECQTRFNVDRNPLGETVLDCPKCDNLEILPGPRNEPAAGKEPVAVSRVSVDCPQCKTHFKATRHLHEPTSLKCPSCGLEDQLPAPTGQPA